MDGEVPFAFELPNMLTPFFPTSGTRQIQPYSQSMGAAAGYYS